MKTKTETLASAMDVLAREIMSSDGVANAATAEAAQRLRELDNDLNSFCRVLGCKEGDAVMAMVKLQKILNTVIPQETHEKHRKQGLF